MMGRIYAARGLIASCAVLCLLLGVNALAAERFVWDANTEPDLSHYRLHWGEESGTYSEFLDVNNVAEFPIAPQFRNQLTFFALTALDTGGLESDFSDEIQLDLRLLPVIIRNENATLAWNPSESSDVLGYKVMWRTQEIANWSSKDVGNTPELQISTLLLPDGAYQFSVVAYDMHGNESPMESVLDVRIDTTPPVAPTGLKILFRD